MLRTSLKVIKISALILFLLSVIALGLRAWYAQRAPELAVWHTYVPREMTIQEIDAGDWNAYLKAESRIFDAEKATMDSGTDETTLRTP